MQFAEKTWGDLRALSRDTPVLIPIAAIEQHGHHMPVATDSLLLAEIVRRIELELGSQLLIAPLQWFGNSDHHLDFGGTLSASPRVYLDILSDLTENCLAAGFKRIVFLNGHGGNDIPAKQALFEVKQRHRQNKDLLLTMTTYWLLGSKPWEIQTDLKQREMGHACEWETSMMLAIRPDLVGDYQRTKPVDHGNPFTPGFRAWVTQDRSEPGHIGYPHLATREKGLALFECFTRDVKDWLERIIRWNGISWDG
jgi:creatinine amidohydrolase